MRVSVSLTLNLQNNYHQVLFSQKKYWRKLIKFKANDILTLLYLKSPKFCQCSLVTSLQNHAIMISKVSFYITSKHIMCIPPGNIYHNALIHITYSNLCLKKKRHFSSFHSSFLILTVNNMCTWLCSYRFGLFIYSFFIFQPFRLYNLTTMYKDTYVLLFISEEVVVNLV